jgi:hypothetical protein
MINVDYIYNKYLSNKISALFNSFSKEVSQIKLIVWVFAIPEILEQKIFIFWGGGVNKITISVKMVTCNKLTNETLHAKTIQAISITKFPNNAYELIKHKGD